MKKNSFCGTYLAVTVAAWKRTGELFAHEFHFSKHQRISDVKPAVHKMPTMASFCISHTRKDVFSFNESIDHQSAVRGGAGADGGVNRQAD